MGEADVQAGRPAGGAAGNSQRCASWMHNTPAGGRGSTQGWRVRPCCCSTRAASTRAAATHASSTCVPSTPNRPSTRTPLWSRCAAPSSPGSQRSRTRRARQVRRRRQRLLVGASLGSASGGEHAHIGCWVCAAVLVWEAMRASCGLPTKPTALARSPPTPPAGAFGCTISGAGPTAVAIVSDPEVGVGWVVLRLLLACER